MSALDQQLFHLINGVWTCGFFDWFFPTLSDANRLGVVAFVLAPAAVSGWLWFGRRRALQAFLGLALVVAAADVTGSRVIKPWLHRARPQNAGLDVVLRLPPAGGYSFPSNHAANCFAGAVFLGVIYPGTLAPLLTGALLVGYSRVYVGAHFPSDVAAGALLGWAIGYGGALALKRYRKKRRKAEAS